MLKKILAATIIVIIIATSFAIFSQTGMALSTDPVKLKMYIGPSKVPADNQEYTCIFVQLLDSSGNPARAIQYTSISLSSSATNIGTVDDFITIAPGDTYGSAKFYSTNTAGTTTITGAESGFATVQGTITTSTLGTTASKLAVFCSPLTLPADNESYHTIQIQLQDSQGRPTKSSEDLQIDAFSSQPSIGTINPIITIHAGETQTTEDIKATNAPGTTTISAQAENFTLGQATITTVFIDLSTLKIDLTINPQAVPNGNKTTISSYVTADGNPIAGATLKFTSDKGGQFSSTKDEGQGFYTTTFTAPSLSKTSNCTITATVSKTTYLPFQTTAQVTVGSAASGTGSLQFYITNEDGTPLSDTVISSTTQPTNTNSLFEVSNQTGYAIFNNLTSGTYTFRIVKSGYPQMNETINYQGPKMLSLTLTLSNEKPIENTTLIITISIIAIAAIAAVTSVLLIVRRKKSEKIRKLRDLQKQLKYKY
jgi:hypothetical protein